jgi:septum formation inhibitor-activating ATPase MinD
MKTQEQLINAFETALEDAVVKLAQNRFSDTKSAISKAKLAIIALNTFFPEVSTVEFSAQITTLIEQAEMKQEKEPEKTRDQQLIDHGDPHSDRSRNYNRGRLLGVHQITEFKKKKQSETLSWLMPRRLAAEVAGVPTASPVPTTAIKLSK